MNKTAITGFVALMLGTVTAYGETKVSGSISTQGISSKQYSSLAKISLTEATAKATQHIQGKVSEAALEEEDDSLVYSVELIAEGGKRVEVLVDAGDGKILSVEDDD